MTDPLPGARKQNRLQVIEANLLGGATVGQIAAALGEPVDVTAATILEMVERWRREWATLDSTGTEINLRRVDLAINALWSAKSVQSGDTGAITQILKLMELREELLDKVPPEPFPAGEKVPGQAESRTAFKLFLALGERLPWWREYLEIRERLAERQAAGEIERADWRLAAYIAWASLPVTGRWPETEEKLANQVLGLKSARTIRKWKVKHPWLEEEIEFWRVAPLARHRPDVFKALIEVATTADPRAHSDRKLYLEMTRDYSPKGTLDVWANAAVMELPVPDLSDEELDAILENLLIAQEHQGGASRQAGNRGEGSPTSEEIPGSGADPNNEDH